ncbi:uncharacterized protein PGTG_12435 [Puccinia graminis f. sp. tritici CRL 75-36-700-3]|uniref:Uncharacterized protein n=1 Tax=Puccinia graminis f. sp. tritici (strain CRL 75-36-700-3 / race SCCL) TaxID=418459 RepID=E3KQA4_PUCGT|nr:uncharacterized protein PGTG_12435 [Puccinia graminis f. sp. tritici CRL 75-36-700-3]EFP86479.1 hypothetical protein PGTG_12435 [Puccinia graminis f. sp. tritici CRL 75-36-700-3]
MKKADEGAKSVARKRGNLKKGSDDQRGQLETREDLKMSTLQCSAGLYTARFLGSARGGIKGEAEGRTEELMGVPGGRVDQQRPKFSFRRRFWLPRKTRQGLHSLLDESSERVRLG